jgi:N,N'-diacetyllegionaminate synthase
MDGMVKKLEIAGHVIGPGYPCFIIAEAGVNHNGSEEIAQHLIDAAAEAGADAVKFQTFQTDELVTRSAPKAEYQLQTTPAGESQHEMLRKLELSIEGHRHLIAQCEKKGLVFLSTPFDEGSADLLESLGVAAFKIPSGELTNLPFLEHVARKNKPIILSTGMATLAEVEAAVAALRGAGNEAIILLQCVSSYPANPADVNLRAMITMARTFKVPVGYSDHTLGQEVALAAAALGASVIEKHFTLDRALPGPDHKASIEPEELRTLVRSVRIVESALGDGEKKPVPSEANTAMIARKSLVAARDIPVDTTVTIDMIATRRPGTGVSPALRDQIVGRRTCTSIAEGTALTFDMLS